MLVELSGWSVLKELLLEAWIEGIAFYMPAETK